uniref:Secreted protein n=1 Tax=Ixodes ricinus TaxID=34613 RepID=A0A6B0U2V8_IXORI
MHHCCQLLHPIFTLLLMLLQSSLPLFPLPKFLHLPLKLGSLVPFLPQFSCHALYLAFPFLGQLFHVRLGPLNQLFDMRLELNPLLPLHPYLPL